MPSIEEIRTALGKMDKSSEKSLIESSNIINENVNPNPFSGQLFAPVEQLESEIQDKDMIIESLRNESTELKNQVSIVEKEKSTILEELEKSRWLESKVALATKKVYEDKVKSIINVNVDSKLIPVLTAVARRKQGNQQLNWGNWLKIPENRYLFQVNEDIARKVFEDTTALIPRERTRGGGATKFVNNYSLTFTGNTESSGTSDYVSTTFDPDDYNLNTTGFTLSYWVRPDELGNYMFALGRQPNSNERFEFGIYTTTKQFIGVGSGRKRVELHGMSTGNWYHWAITYAGNSASPKTLKAYRDGTEVLDTTASWPQTGGDAPIYFGARNNGGYSQGWDCNLDEVAIFDEVKDVSILYNSGTPSDLSGEDGLVGYWRFEEGGGTTVEDLSGEGNHGTLTTDDTGLPAWSTDTS
jgi:hypothetical protein